VECFFHAGNVAFFNPVVTWRGRFAPPLSTMYKQGILQAAAISCSLRCFLTWEKGAQKGEGVRKAWLPTLLQNQKKKRRSGIFAAYIFCVCLFMCVCVCTTFDVNKMHPCKRAIVLCASSVIPLWDFVLEGWCCKRTSQ
jgi:hypothetical protein